MFRNGCLLTALLIGSLTLASFVHAGDERDTYNLVMSEDSKTENANKEPSIDLERLRSISFNSREVRLVGPDRKAVEMKDDVPTKVLVVLDNLQKEAKEAWGQATKTWDELSVKLDKGWTDFRGMVEKAVKPKA